MGQIPNITPATNRNGYQGLTGLNSAFSSAGWGRHVSLSSACRWVHIDQLQRGSAWLSVGRSAPDVNAWINWTTIKTRHDLQDPLPNFNNLSIFITLCDANWKFQGNFIQIEIMTVCNGAQHQHSNWDHYTWSFEKAAATQLGLSRLASHPESLKNLLKSKTLSLGSHFVQDRFVTTPMVKNGWHTAPCNREGIEENWIKGCPFILAGAWGR